MSGKPLPVQRNELRNGILRYETWEKVFKLNVKTWKAKGGYQLDGKEPATGTETFNFWSAANNAQIDFEELDPAEAGDFVGAERADGAEIEYSRLPYFERTQVKKRPSLLMFEVTGHVMIAIYFGNLGKGEGRRELHILNPWPLKGSTQLKDVYALFDLKMPAKARTILVADVADEVQSISKGEINLQQHEKQGFCTLWVGIIAARAIQIMKELSETVDANRSTPTVSGVLALPVKTLYKTKVYNVLQQKLDENMRRIAEELPMVSCQYLASAQATESMAEEALGKGGKRTVGRRTRKKIPKWKRRGRHSSSTVRRTRRIARRSGRAI